MEFWEWIERAALIGGGTLVPLIINWLRDRSAARYDLISKRTLDETDISQVILQHNQERYNMVLKELDALKQRVEILISQVRTLELENMRLRILCGINPDDPIPTTREEVSDWKATICEVDE